MKKLWYAYTVIILIVMLSSIQVGNTVMSGEWIFEKPINPKILAKMLKTGPNYQYRIQYDGELQVSKDEGGSWMRLGY